MQRSLRGWFRREDGWEGRLGRGEKGEKGVGAGG